MSDLEQAILEETEKMAAKTPAVVSVISDVDTPVSVFHRLSAGADTAFLLEGAEAGSRLARYSFVGIDPVKTISFREGKATVKNGSDQVEEIADIENPLTILKDYLQAFKTRLPDELADLPFTGGLVGYLGYGATQYFEGIPQQVKNPFGVPEGFYGLYDSVILFDHLYRRIKIISYRGEKHARELLKRLTESRSLPELPLVDSRELDESIFDGVEEPFTREGFEAAVRKCREYIKEGQIFQIVLSQRFSVPVTTDALNIYRVLQALNPSPYAYMLKCPDLVYLGSSPETFVKARHGRAELRVLAGTRPRGESADKDRLLAAELASDQKELAEHRMLVDLGRNDLGRICKPGSIDVGEIAQLTRYTHVMHLSTEISGDIDEGKDCFDVFQSCFPRGTVSGAPKVRAMQLLSKLEPEQRGVYSGVVGYFDFSGNMDGAIAIRSALVKDGKAHVNAGAGIVYDSRPDAEYEETRNKAKSVIKAIKLAERTAGNGSTSNR